jgi:hypothetical protein
MNILMASWAIPLLLAFSACHHAEPVTDGDTAPPRVDLRPEGESSVSSAQPSAEPLSTRPWECHLPQQPPQPERGLPPCGCRPSDTACNRVCKDFTIQQSRRKN